MHKLLVLPLLLILAFGTLPFLHASEDLVKNGGFETGDFTGWTATNSKVRTHSTKGTYYEPAHSGKYSARIGTETIEGRIAQTISIPPKSSAKFTAWYRVEKGSSLTVSLKASDGTIIEQWGVTSVTSWTSAMYDLPLAYAGQSVTIEFVGVGYRETTTTTVYQYYCDPVTNVCYSYPMMYESHRDYWPYVDDVSLTYEVVVYEISVAVSGLPEELSTKLLVDGAQLSTIAGEQSKILPFKIGETHKISVETYVSKNNETRYYCASDSATVSSDNQITFSYKPQHYLSVSSPYGNTTGRGWYGEGYEASFSIDRTAFPVADFTGTLGAKHVFVKWTGDASSGADKGKIVMDGPKSISAVWTVDNSLFYLSIAIIVSGSIGGIGGAYRFITRREIPLKLPFKRPVEVPVGGEEPSKEGEIITPAPSPEEQEVLDRMDRLEISFKEGTVTEKAYKKLREDLEKRLDEIRVRKAK